ncbi:hypothetical protein B0H66DRAFT_546319 [Apodospora peruviana]|uniref:Protein kinase domain-containing protein n=1 Tax=Apodospora peruviana TaxID=516989 RepID=A0AAE0IVI5_9PEZI|nr:hypothetical protein B0H66DRAFT_546319 [Apodospora peruviana]
MVSDPASDRSSDPVQAFRDYIDYLSGEHLHDGLDGHNNARRFVCRAALASYWTIDKIREVLGPERFFQDQDISLDIHTFQLLILSILCHIGQPLYITVFVRNQVTDARLPLFPALFQDGRWPQDPQSLRTWGLFSERQWAFCPLIFGARGNKVPIDLVLPIRSMIELNVRSGSLSTSIYKVSLYRCCNRWSTDDVVFKILDSRAGHLWKNETDIYSSLFSSPDNDLSSTRYREEGSDLGIPTVGLSSVAGYFGSYVLQTRCNWPQSTGKGTQLTVLDRVDESPSRGELVVPKYIIVLEYACGGTLTEFCQQNMPLLSSPAQRDKLAFWHQMFNILPGLHAIHRLSITHRDVKGTNILYTGAPIHNTGEPCFKLADFGFGDLGGGGEVARRGTRASRRGNQIYSRFWFQSSPMLLSTLFWVWLPCQVRSILDTHYLTASPECCGVHSHPVQWTSRPQPYTPAADIWALGCLFSDTLVKCRLGQESVERYWKQRILENGSTPLRNLEWDSGFHDGRNRLSTVDDMHREALDGCADDDVLHIVSRLVLGWMLQPLERRELVDAWQLRCLWVQAVSARRSISADSIITTTACDAVVFYDANSRIIVYHSNLHFILNRRMQRSRQPSPFIVFLIASPPGDPGSDATPPTHRPILSRWPRCTLRVSTGSMYFRNATRSASASMTRTGITICCLGSTAKRVRMSHFEHT